MKIKRPESTLLAEKKYRNQPHVKQYQKEYGRLYRAFQKGEISLEEFEMLKPRLYGK